MNPQNLFCEKRKGKDKEKMRKETVCKVLNWCWYD